MAKKRKSRVRFARVPSGVDTCKFCAMLASRGAVYSSEETAGKEIHENCHCTCVPSWGGSDIEGYDPEEYYDRWKHPEIYEGLDSIIANSLACLRVAEKRGFVKYDKPLLSFLNTEDGKRDLIAHATLAKNGKRFRALAEDAPEGFSNIDLEMDGAKWEVKSPPGDNPRAVESNLRKAKKQSAKNYPNPLDETNVVFNGYYYGQTDEWVAAKLSYESNRHGIDNVLYVDKNGQLRQIEKVRTPYPERPDLQTGSSIAHSASSMEEHRSPKPMTEVRSLGGVPETQNGFMLNTIADPALDYFGSAESSHPYELQAIKDDLASSRVSVNVRDRDHEAIGYGPSVSPGIPGSMTVTDGMSYSAWRHEYRHFCSDRELGYPGRMAYYKDLELYAEMERNAYNDEIDLARQFGYNNLAEKLIALRDDVIAQIESGDIFGNQ